jgi:hypothetical protein
MIRVIVTLKTNEYESYYDYNAVYHCKNEW